ncbi:TonB-dependent receptor [Sinimarinibacterium thermocellulolyticum]|uniref:TonB-dependent receptor n=1 Tax=Sinimarinibacterium thermocellulolyticum TaxID=3170016 RepID=A0ABV2A7T2_9GAMM
MRSMVNCRWALIAVLMTCASAFAQDDLDFLLTPEQGQPSQTPSPDAPAAVPEAEAESAEASPPPPAAPVPEAGPDTAGGSVEPAAAAPARRRPSSRLVEEIIVTAQKREENLQNVPITVQAFSAERLDAMGITTQEDLPLVTPGMTVTNTSGFSIVYIRGVGSDTFLMGDPNVATYIDGVYLPFAALQAGQQFGLDRIEVLKGPQGTLFGRGANGGAVNIITKRPSLTESETEFQIGFDSFNTIEAKLFTSIPVTDTVAFSLSTLYKSGDHWYDEDSRAGGEPLPKISSQSARLKLLWAPTERLDVTLSFLKSLEQGTSSGLQGNCEPSLLARLVGIRPQCGYTVENDVPVFAHTNNTIYSLSSTWNTDWFDVKVLGSYQNQEPSGLFIDFDGAPQPVAYFGTKNGAINRVDTAEFQLVSNENSWGADWLRWNAGFYWVQWDARLDPVFLALAGLDLSTGVENATISLPPGLVDLLDALLEPLLGFGVPSGQIRLVGANTLNSRALYFQATADLSERFALTVGARAQDETRYLDESSSGLGDTNVDPVVFIQRYTGQKRNVRSLKPKVTLEFRPDPGLELMTYASFQQAIKGSQYNLINIYDPPEEIEPEEMDAYEIGIKWSPFGGLATFNAAAFWYEITNLQVQFVSLLQGGAVTQENAGGARNRGFEFDALVPLFPNTIDNLILIANGTYLDAVYTEYKNGSGFDPVTGLLQTG